MDALTMQQNVKSMYSTVCVLPPGHHTEECKKNAWGSYLAEDCTKYALWRTRYITNYLVTVP
jgi:hypothetical protein